jgi:hypothetical protein
LLEDFDLSKHVDLFLAGFRQKLIQVTIDNLETFETFQRVKPEVLGELNVRLQINFEFLPGGFTRCWPIQFRQQPLQIISRAAQTHINRWSKSASRFCLCSSTRFVVEFRCCQSQFQK